MQAAGIDRASGGGAHVKANALRAHRDDGVDESSEADRLSELIGLLHDAALDPALWPRALKQACLFVGGSSGNLFWHDAATGRSVVLHLFDEEPHPLELDFEKYLPLNPCFPAATFVETGQVWGTSDLVPFEDMVKTRFYREWMKPQGIIDALAANLEKDATSASVISVRMHEKDGLVDADNRRRLALIVPHVQRAVAIGRLFDQGRAAQGVLTQTLDNVAAAIFLVGANARLVHANAPGRAMLEDGALLVERMGQLAAVSPDVQRVLRDALDAAEAGHDGARPIQLPTSPARCSAHVLPLASGDRQDNGALHSAVAALFVRNISPASAPRFDALAKLYKLTASEARVIDAIMKVSGVKALAECLGVREATVKTHLQGVFRKTGTASQGELIKRITGFMQPRPE